MPREGFPPSLSSAPFCDCSGSPINGGISVPACPFALSGTPQQDLLVGPLQPAQGCGDTGGTDWTQPSIRPDW